MTQNLKSTQLEFAAHIRNPELNARPKGIEDRRMGIYRELVFNNVEGFISGGFPILRKLYSDDDWRAMVRDFFIQHRCTSPYFLEISEEFLAYLQLERDLSKDPAFIVELAHYEWVELALDIAKESIPETGYNPTGDLLAGRPAISPVAWVLQYSWPVHKIGPSFQPTEPGAQPTFLIVYRRRDFMIKFMEVNAVTARLFTILSENPSFSGLKAIERIGAELQASDMAPIIEGGRQALEHLRSVDIVLGTELKPI